MAKRGRQTEVIRVAPYDLPVCLVPPDDAKLNSGKDSHDGAFYPQPCPHIVIADNLTGLYAAAVRLHESVEAIGELHGLNLREYQVVGLESGLLRLIRDNPQLIRDIQT